MQRKLVPNLSLRPGYPINKTIMRKMEAVAHPALVENLRIHLNFTITSVSSIKDRICCTL